MAPKKKNTTARTKRNAPSRRPPALPAADLPVDPRRARAAERVAELKALTPERFAKEGPTISLRPDAIDVGGETISLPSKAIDPDVERLSQLAAELMHRARQTRGPWLVSTAHVLSAMVHILREHRFADLRDPHRWARRHLRKTSSSAISTPDGETISVYSASYIPWSGKGSTEVGMASGYDVLASLLRALIVDCRRAKQSLANCSSVVTECLMYNFPGLLSPNDWAVGYEELVARIHDRVVPQLAAQEKKWRAAEPARAAADIAESLLVMELQLSGRTEEQVAREVAFLKGRSGRVKH